ncbi:MAG: hypothetical protein WC868_07170 [Bacteroidales bacterium]
MIRQKIIIGLFLLSGFSFSQNYCDCDTVRKNKNFTNFCREYLDYRFVPVEKGKANFVRYVFYWKGKKSSRYPWEVFFRKDRWVHDGKEISYTDTLELLNGLYQSKDKKGRIKEEYNYKNGLLVKVLNKDRSVFRAKEKGKKVKEILEYDYLKFPFTIHYNCYNHKGKIKYNTFEFYDNGYWTGRLSKKEMNENMFEIATDP